MAFSVNTICCCSSTNLLLNIPSPNPSSSFLFPSGHRRLPLLVLKNKAVNHQISCSIQRKEEEDCSWRWPRSRRNQYVLGMMACMIINSTNLSLPFAAAAAAAAATTTTHHHHEQAATAVAAGNSTTVKKWSDKQRVCQPWRLNSLETIVPENLPRPSAHRRSESISTTLSSSSPSPDHQTRTSTAPPLVNSNIVLVNNCFSM